MQLQVQRATLVPTDEDGVARPRSTHAWTHARRLLLACCGLVIVLQCIAIALLLEFCGQLHVDSIVPQPSQHAPPAWPPPLPRTPPSPPLPPPSPPLPPHRPPCPPATPSPKSGAVRERANDLNVERTIWTAGLRHSDPIYEPWKQYLDIVYHGTAKPPLPFDPFQFHMLYSDVMAHVGLGLSFHDCHRGLVDGERFRKRVWFESDTPYRFVYHSNRDPLPSHTWVEITHHAPRPDILHESFSLVDRRTNMGWWTYYTPGSGVWINTKRTIFFEDHQSGFDYFNVTTQHYEDVFSKAAAMGFDSVQFIHWSDQCTWCRTDAAAVAAAKSPASLECPHTAGRGGPLNLAIELVLTNYSELDGICALGPEMRAGWDASLPCNCTAAGTSGKWSYARCVR